MPAKFFSRIAEAITRRPRFWLAALALAYAFFAGFRTVSDPDLGWQIATGRWIVQHHAIPSVDVLSYTGAGRPWIYPFLSQVVLWAVSAAGGYTLLTYLTIAGCVGTIALMLWRGQKITMVLAALAVPLIAERTPARAELFTEVLLAAFTGLLWSYHRNGKGRLSLLPLLMVLWVNLHQGFIAGIAMCVAYAALECEDLLSVSYRAAARTRLRAAAPWLLATVAATLINPWTYRNYLGMVNFLPVQSTRWIMELNSRSITWDSLRAALAWREPGSAVWWMVLAAGLGVLAALWQRRFVPAAILAFSIYANFHSVRLVGPFAIVTVILGGSILESAVARLRQTEGWKRLAARQRVRLTSCAAAGFILFALFLGVRVWDLVTDRAYMRDSSQLSSFGTGPGRWMPEGATSFILRHRLPGNVFNEYTTGGFAVWKLGPAYPDYVDGRGDPFPDVFFRWMELLNAPLDSPVWREEAARRNIKTLLLSMDHTYGSAVPMLGSMCGSQNWRPVYMDAQAAVFVLRTPETAQLVDSLQIDCRQVQFDNPPTAGYFARRAPRFHSLLSGAAVLNALGRPSDALVLLNRAQAIFEGNYELHYMEGAAYLALGNKLAGERELRRSLELQPYDAASILLGSLLRDENRLDESMTVIDRALRTSDSHRHELYLAQAVLNLDRRLPAEALTSLDRADAASPLKGQAAALGPGFVKKLAAVRSIAWTQLAESYEGRGMMQQANDARARAASYQAESLP